MSTNGPQEIKPKRIRSRNSYRSTINPRGYYGKFINVQGPYKRVTTGSITGNTTIEDSTKMSVSNLIKESILKKIANKHVNRYMKTSDGKALKAAVSELIQKKKNERPKII